MSEIARNPLSAAPRANVNPDGLPHRERESMHRQPMLASVLLGDCAALERECS